MKRMRLVLWWLAFRILDPAEGALRYVMGRIKSRRISMNRVIFWTAIAFAVWIGWAAIEAAMRAIEILAAR